MLFSIHCVLGEAFGLVSWLTHIHCMVGTGLLCKYSQMSCISIITLAAHLWDIYQHNIMLYMCYIFATIQNITVKNEWVMLWDIIISYVKIVHYLPLLFTHMIHIIFYIFCCQYCILLTLIYRTIIGREHKLKVLYLNLKYCLFL